MTLRTSILLCTCLLLLFTTSFAQQRAPRYFSEKLLQLKIDSLRSNFGMHKTLPEKYELEALVALSYFPELEQSTINFKIKKIRSTMAARPAGLQFLRGKGKKKYNKGIFKQYGSEYLSIRLLQIQGDCQSADCSR